MIGAKDKCGSIDEVKMMPFSKTHVRTPLNALQLRDLRACTPLNARLFYPALIAAATVIFANVARAEMSLDPTCIFDEGSQGSCTHVVACIGGDTVFVGGSTGWDAGTLAGELSSGAACTGSWDNATGRAQFSCDNEEAGEVIYTTIDDATGTGIGSGVTVSGRAIEAWSGRNIADFIERETGRVTLQCGVEDVLLS